MSDAAIDREHFDDLRRDFSAAELEQLVAEFAGLAERQVAEVQQAIAAGRADEAARHAHLLRGTAATVGARPLAAAAAAIEQAVREGADEAALRAVGGPLAARADEVRAALRTL
ncbi:Hpt domain-containing protein [Patulibacter defluvii]|uniref:Hpt domain-containing protein n=1 Tax=Patulibacter defluvii TaxID=3095358 RepID=UPI002A75DD20|nr:Hpt domain-containing protein [Patulibacter sp. DM4]